MALRGSEPVARVGGLSKRAPRACELCRARKVRCDVTRTRAPCTNCRLDSKTCVLPANKRRHVGDRVLGASFFEDTQHNPQSPICDAIIDFGDIKKPLSQRSDLDSPVGLVGNGSFDVFDISGNPLSTVDTSNITDSIEHKHGSQPDLLAPYPSPTQTLLDYPHHQSTFPSYIAPMPESIAAEELQYLHSKGAFEIPDTQTRDQLLRAYARWVHPFAPMLDLEQTLTAIFSNGEKGTISLLVFQSMLFAATAYVHADDQQGNQKSTRKAFYERARLLHDFDAETDRLSICQAAVLLSFWDGHPEGVRDSYYWIGIATLHATSIGLNLSPTGNSSSSKQQQTFERTWWTLLVRDRLLAVAMRRPVQIKVFRVDVPMLHLVDFDLEGFLKTLQNTLQIEDLGIEDLETLVNSWMALAQLSEYIEKVLSLQYTVQKSSNTQGKGGVVVSLVPKTNISKSSEIMICGQELQNWYGYLPREVQQFELNHLKVDHQRVNEVVRVHRALLAGYYSMTLLTLYRPLLNVQLTGANGFNLRRVSVNMVSQAAKSVTEIFGNLYADDLILRLPDTAIAALEPAIAIHLLYSMSTVPTVRETSFQKFYLGWRILLHFKQTYHLADTTMSMLNAAAQRLKSLPDLKTLKTEALFQLVDEISSSDDKAARSHMAVSFVGVVEDQKMDRSDVTSDWQMLRRLQEESENPEQVPESDEDNLDVEANCALDPCTFDQLVCWDALEEEF